jgi:hypothetical protein
MDRRSSAPSPPLLWHWGFESGVCVDLLKVKASLAGDGELGAVDDEQETDGSLDEPSWLIGPLFGRSPSTRTSGC